MKKFLIWFIGVSAIALIGFLTVVVVDEAISLAYCRQQNLDNTKRCRHLAKLTGAGLVGANVEAVIEAAGSDAIIKRDGDILEIGDVTFRTKDEKILAVDVDLTCGKVEDEHVVSR